MDSIFLTGPLGTQWNIGSWLDKTDQIDYGAQGLIRQQFAQNAAAEGVRLSFETVAGPRTMRFPLLVPSGGIAGLSLDAIEASLRQMVRPGGYVDVQPAGVATGEMVRFDVVGGDVAHRGYDLDIQRVGRRRYALSLLTQPLGYWPTWIIAGSVASVSLKGGGAVTLSAPLGDVAGLVEMTVLPTTGAQAASGALILDGYAWGNGGRASFVAGLGGGSWGGGNWAASYAADTRGISATESFVAVPVGDPGWGVAFNYTVPAAIEPAYRGRFRVYAITYDQAVPYQVSFDISPGAVSAGANTGSLALASANQVATTAAAGAIGVFATLDLGELTMPPVASGAAQAINLRLWAKRASWGATTLLFNNGVYFQPLDGQAGLISRGLAIPTIGNSPSALTAAGGYQQPDVGVIAITNASAPVTDMTRFYRGVAPQHGATVVQLDLIGFQRYASAASAAVDAYAVNNAYAAVSLRYRPRFQFLKGI